MSYLMGQFYGMCRFEIAYDISVLEANSNVRCLKLYRITLRTSVHRFSLQTTRSRCHVRRHNNHCSNLFVNQQSRARVYS